ncbi:putative non-reducing end alpha-L-arabinofuranosidase [Lupinus albus]|uniref:Putative non-reducing end alpha-L-arabinofuranosidase n=1 Tax=Lupinus albus TaxID=3870 RepID=A0A6A4PWQ9_LUPAL|nr:putative non-reducing end alpha-L-arabinofuranosidase [Lupinus albus]
MTDMRMRADPSSGYPGRTYRFYTGPKVYEFGYGLSYSKYSYKFVSVAKNNIQFDQSSTHLMVENSETVRYKLVSELSEETCQSMSFSVTLGVTNHGSMMGKHPVLLFMRQTKHRHGNPIKHLVGFKSVKLDGGERSEVRFKLNPCEHFSIANEAGLKVIEEGSYLLLAGEEEYPLYIII